MFKSDLNPRTARYEFFGPPARCLSFSSFLSPPMLSTLAAPKKLGAALQHGLLIVLLPLYQV